MSYAVAEPKTRKNENPQMSVEPILLDASEFDSGAELIEAITDKAKEIAAQRNNLTMAEKRFATKPPIFVDISDLEHISTNDLGSFVQANITAKTAGHQFTIVASPEAQERFVQDEINKTGRSIKELPFSNQVHENVEQAMESLNTPQRFH